MAYGNKNNLKPKDLNQLDRTFKEIKKLYEIDKGVKWLVDNNHILADFDDIKRLIETMCFRLLNGFSNNFKRKEKLKKLVFELVKKNKDPDWGKISSEIKKEELNRRTEKYYVLFPLRLKSPQFSGFLFKTLKLLNNAEFRVISHKKAKSDFNDLEKVFEYYRLNSPSKEISKIVSDLLFIEGKFSNMDDDVYKAFNKIYFIFNRLRSIYNISILWGENSTHRSLDILSILQNPDIYLLKDRRGKVIEYARHRPLQKDYVKRFQDLGAKREKIYRRFKRTAQKGRKCSQVGKLILRCCDLYNEALDDIDLNHRFICFWRVCEHAISPEGYRPDTSKRITKLFKVFSRVKSDEVGNMLLRIRNHIVHNGEFEYLNETYINWAKQLAEISIGLLFWIEDEGFGKYYDDVERFFDLYMKDSKDLDQFLKIGLALKRSRYRN